MSKMTSTQISNGTAHALKVQVGIGRHVSDMATVEPGKELAIGVDRNATYREYTLGVAAEGLAKVVVSSDDLSDYKCITVKEESGRLAVYNEARQAASPPVAVAPSKLSTKKSSWLPSWMST